MISVEALEEYERVRGEDAVREFTRLAKQAAGERERTPTEEEIEAAVRGAGGTVAGRAATALDAVLYGPDPDERAIVEAVKGGRRKWFREPRGGRKG